jgi:hypothetical protein
MGSELLGISIYRSSKPVVDELFLHLASHASVLEGVFSLAGQGRLSGLIDARNLARLIGVGSAKLPDVLLGLRAASLVGAVAQNESGLWHVILPPDQCRSLSLLLRGAKLYKERVHQDRDSVRVVISKPAEPSQLAAALERTLEGTWGMGTTEDILGEMAASARSRFTIMSPFIDQDGASRIVDLFEATRTNVRRELVVRDGLPPELHCHADSLKRLDVCIFNFRLPRSERVDRETFHAKVVRRDEDECYVGSSNMTRWSFKYSLELGFQVTGSAGEQVSRVIDAVIDVSPQIAL